MPVEAPIPETKEEMAEFVDQLASEAEAETARDEKPEKAEKVSENTEKPSKKAAREKAEKPDAQITTEHADEKKKPRAKKGDAKPKSGDEDTAAENEKISHSEASEKTGKAKKADSEEDWRDEAKAEAAAYGFSEKDIAEFESREELDRALKLFDRNLDAERKKVLESEGDKDKGGEAQKKEPESTVGQSTDADDGTYQVRLNKDVYDEEIVGEFTRLRDHYESRLAALEERFHSSDAVAEEERFDRSVDALDFSQLFGTTGEEDTDEHERRNELLERVRIEQVVMSRLGRNVDYNALVRRVARATFPDDYDKKLLKNHTRRISRQSDQRQGGGATRPTDPPENPRDAADRMYKELERA